MSKSRDYADLKQDLDNAAFTGQYSDLDGLPTIPTTLSELTNDSGYLTSVSLGLDDLSDVTTSAAGDNKFLTKTGSTYLFTGLEYSDLTGTPDAISAGTGVSLASGEIAIGQAVGTTDAPTFTNMTLNGTGSIQVPSGTLAQRDSTPVNGMFRYNSEDNQFEGYANGAWGAIAGGGGGSLATDILTGDGTTTDFTLTKSVASENDLIIFINGVFQAQDTYSVSGTTLTFSTAPANTRVITAYQMTAIAAEGEDTTITINNNADNRIITGSGTANTLEGEANLTFDGTNLGIGETNSANLLHVKASDTGIAPHASAQIVLEREGTNYLQFLTAENGTSGLLFGDGSDIDVSKITVDHNTTKMTFVNETAETMVLNGSNVGIGTASPSAPLDIQSNSAASAIRIRGRSDDIAEVDFYNNANDSVMARFQADTGYLATHVGGSEAMRIDSDGRLGIGTTSPTAGANLDVQGGYIRCKNVYMGTGSGGSKFEGGNGSYEPGTGNLLTGSYGLNLNFLVAVTGVGVSTAARVDSPSGDFYTNDGSVSALSDERVKTDINDLTDGLDLVKQLRPVTFKYNDNSTDADGNHLLGCCNMKPRYGFIAQEVEQVAPQYVEVATGTINNEEVDDFRSLSIGRMTPMLFKAIQEQQELIETQSTLIADLTTRLETLENA